MGTAWEQVYYCLRFQMCASHCDDTRRFNLRFLLTLLQNNPIFIQI